MSQECASWCVAKPHGTSSRRPACGSSFAILAMNHRTRPRGDGHQRRRKQILLVQSQFPVSLDSLVKAQTKPPISAGEIVFSSTKTTPPCVRPSSAQFLSRGGIVLRSYVTSVNPWAAASPKQGESACPRKCPFSHSTI